MTTPTTPTTTPTLHLRGLGLRAAWSRGLDEHVDLPASSCEDDFRVEPDGGVAVVASGRGAIGAPGRPGAVLATWSVVGEATSPTTLGGEARLDAGLRRAHEAVHRLTWSWRGAIRPSTSIAALTLAGDRLHYAHLGTARISRLSAAGVVALTRDHSVRAEFAAAGRPLPPEFAIVADAPTHTLGAGTFLGDRGSVPARSGEWFLLASASVHRALDDDAIAEALDLSRPSRPDPEGLEVRVFDLVDRLRATAESLSFAVAIIGPTADPRPWPRPAIGGSPRPREGWLFQPGRPLPEPPPRWRPETGSSGPDAAWFAEIADPLREV